MRTRQIKKQIWLNKNEATHLKKKAKKVGLNESELIRSLILGFEPKEKPDDRFYDAMRQMNAIGNNLNQIARMANAMGVIDELEYKKNVEKLNFFIIRLKKEFLLPKES